MSERAQQRAIFLTDFQVPRHRPDGSKRQRLTFFPQITSQVAGSTSSYYVGEGRDVSFKTRRIGCVTLDCRAASESRHFKPNPSLANRTTRSSGVVFHSFRLVVWSVSARLRTR